MGIDGIFASSHVRSRSTKEQIEIAEHELGIVFPLSYKRFCLEYGLGVIDDLFMIYVPGADIEDASSITVRSRWFDDMILESLRNWTEDGMTIGVDVWEGGTAELLRRAVFFGESFNGDWIFWDAQGDAEFDIYVWAGGQEVRFGGKTLDEFIRRTQTEEIKTILGPGYTPLTGRFEGRD